MAKKSRNLCLNFSKPKYEVVIHMLLFLKHLIKDYKIDDMKISSFMISVPDGSEIGTH